TGRADEETAREGLAGWAADGVEGLPRDEHGDDCGLAGAGGKFQSDAEELWIGLLVSGLGIIQEFFGALALVRSYLDKPNGSFNRFDLGEKGRGGGKGVASPMLQETGGFGCDLPLIRVGQLAPLVDIPTDFVDDGVGIVLLLRRGNAFFVFK